LVSSLYQRQSKLVLELRWITAIKIQKKTEKYTKLTLSTPKSDKHLILLEIHPEYSNIEPETGLILRPYDKTMNKLSEPHNIW
jgi:hypothetical protein